MVSGQDDRPEDVCGSVEPELGNEWADFAKRLCRDQPVAIRGERLEIRSKLSVEGNIRMALAGLAVTAIMFLKATRLRKPFVLDLAGSDGSRNSASQRRKILSRGFYDKSRSAKPGETGRLCGSAQSEDLANAWNFRIIYTPV